MSPAGEIALVTRARRGLGLAVAVGNVSIRPPATGVRDAMGGPIPPRAPRAPRLE